jgi:hypothetical protein
VTTAPHRIRYQGGDKILHHVPRDRYGRAAVVSGATYSIVRLWKSEDDAERDVQASAAATTDTATATLDGSAGPAQSNPKLIPVDDESDFVIGRHYLLSEGEISQLVVCAGVDVGQVLCTQEIRNAYTTEATLSGIEIPGTFPTAAAADEDDLESGGGPYGVIWSYTIADVDYYPLEEAWVVRYDTQPLITTADLERRWPEAASMVSGRWGLEDAIATATDDFLADVEASGRDPHGLRHSAVTRVCVADKALEKLHRWARTDRSDEYADVLRQDYDRRLRDLLTGQPPVRTAEVRQPTNTATQGGSKTYGTPILRRS